MRASIERQLRDLARRAGVGEVSPIAVVAAGVALACVVVVAAFAWLPRGTDVALAPRGEAAAASASPSASLSAARSEGPTGGIGASSACVVHVVGAVRHPGVYEMRAGQRVNDAVSAAGGLLGSAAPEGVNLAAVLRDGEQIAIPTRDEAKAGGARDTGTAAAATTGGSSVVDLNTADASALDALPGIGPATAAKIVADRQANGPFASTDDLGRVPGIGPKKIEQLKGLICAR